MEKFIQAKLAAGAQSDPSGLDLCHSQPARRLTTRRAWEIPKAHGSASRVALIFFPRKCPPLVFPGLNEHNQWAREEKVRGFRRRPLPFQAWGFLVGAANPPPTWPASGGCLLPGERQPSLCRSPPSTPPLRFPETGSLLTSLGSLKESKLINTKVCTDVNI